jgi:two-component system, NarL family, nitrate/nitrite response regulator NarL
MDSHAPALAASGPFLGLTRRQLQIIQLLKTGASNKEIARVLNISEGTVKVHLHSIYEKLGVTSRSKLVVLLLSTALIASKYER